MKPPVKHYPEAEYEIMIVAIDPTNRNQNPKHDYEPDEDEMYDGGIPFLLPIDLVYQFHGVGDEQAKRIVQDCVLAIVNGLASPDQDWRAWWKNALDSTVKHYREGRHELQ